MAHKKKFLKQVAYNFAYALVRVLAAVFRYLPEGFIYALARLVGWLGYHVVGGQRRTALEGLRIAFGQEKSERERRAIARGCFREMASSALEFFMLMAHPQRLRQCVSIKGRKHLDQALAQGRGVIMLSAHMGSFPILISKIALEGYKIHTMLRRSRDQRLDRFFQSRRDNIGVGSIYTQPRASCVRESLKALRDNEIIFIQMDQNFGTAGVFVDFFGVQAATATGPVVLALRTGALIVPTFIHRLHDARQEIIMESPIALSEDPAVERMELVTRYVAELTKLIETYVRLYPSQWGWIHKRWKVRPKSSSLVVSEEVAMLDV